MNTRSAREMAKVYSRQSGVLFELLRLYRLLYGVHILHDGKKTAIERRIVTLKDVEFPNDLG